jgi:hypothetical protein
MVEAFEAGKPDGRGYCNVEIFEAGRPGMNFFVIFMSMKLLVVPCGYCDLISKRGSPFHTEY